MIAIRKTLAGLTTLAALALLAPISAHAQFAFGGDGPIDVDADKIEYKGELTILTGQVQVVQAGTRILADQMKLFRSRLPGGQLGDVTRIEADGDFYYISPEQKVSGKRGVYEQQSNRITVTGDVILGDNTGNVGTTERFVYDLGTKNAVLEGTCKGRACTSGRPSLIIDNGNRN